MGGKGSWAGARQCCLAEEENGFPRNLIRGLSSAPASDPAHFQAHVPRRLVQGLLCLLPVLQGGAMAARAHRMCSCPLVPCLKEKPGPRFLEPFLAMCPPLAPSPFGSELLSFIQERGVSGWRLFPPISLPGQHRPPGLGRTRKGRTMPWVVHKSKRIPCNGFSFLLRGCPFSF